jgi:hypothetical protein
MLALYVVVNSKVVGLAPGSVSYNASTVKNYKATSSLVRFKNKKKIFSSSLNNAQAYYNAGVEMKIQKS